MQISSSLLGALFSGSGSSNALVTAALGTASGSAPARDPIAVLKDAEKNRTTQIAAKAKDPKIKREIDDFVKGVLKAKSVDELLADPKVLKVLLTASGLEEFTTARGLAAKALKSDPEDPQGLARRLVDTNAAWLSAASTYQFASKGLAIIQDRNTLFEVSQSYAEARWREGLDAAAPGVSFALAFKDKAADLKSVFNILGDSVAREVVTTALGIPRQIAYQSLEAQSRAITSRLDIAKLQKPAFVDAFVRRYLVELNLGTSGVTA